MLRQEWVESLHTVARRPFAAPSAADPGRVVHTRADLRAAAARRALEGVDVLFHLGFQLWRGVGGTPAMTTANLEGTANVLAAGPRRVVLASSAAVYGAWPDNPLPMTEDHPPRPNPQCPYAADKLAVEDACTHAAPTVALRIAAVLGSRADPRVGRAVHGYRLAVPAVRGAPQAVQFVGEQDVVAALVAAGARQITGVCNVATDDWLDASGIAALSGGRVVVLPRRLLLSGAELGRRLRLLPFGADRAALLGGPLALDVAKARQLLSWEPSQSSRDVLRAALQHDSGAPARRGLEQ